MDRHIEELYKAAPRFDESDLMLSSLYTDAMCRQFCYMARLEERFGQDAAKLAEEILCTTYDITELEAKHFFREGYRAGLLDRMR